MSTYTTRDAVSFAVSGEATKFKDAVNDILMSKVADAIEVERYNVAQGMFAEPEQEDVSTDEDV